MKKVKISFCVTFIGILFLFMIFTLNNNKEVSVLEKRNLETFPKFDFQKLLDSNYYDKLTLAFSDQLEFRDFLVRGYYLFQFQKYNGDVVIGKNNELYSAYQNITNEESYLKSLSKTVSIINEVADEVTEYGSKFIFLSIPRKDSVETKNLPDSYIGSEEIYKKALSTIEKEINSNVNLIDSYKIFNDNKKEGFKFYYLTDHHITPRAAFLIYDEILNFTNIKKYDFEKYYNIEKTIINGSFNNQIGQSVKTSEEELCIIPKFNIDYKRSENEKESNLKVFGKGNTYEDCFMQGDHAYTIIDTNRDKLPNIMFVGSSFTNIFETISVKDFNKIISIDYRHNTTKTSIIEYVKKHDVDYVIYLPSQSNNAFSSSMIKTHLGK